MYDQHLVQTVWAVENTRGKTAGVEMCQKRKCQSKEFECHTRVVDWIRHVRESVSG